MSYRFRNKGEKSDLQRAYEYINKHDIGAEFHVHVIMQEVGIPQNTASAALAYLANSGMLERFPEKVRPKGRTYPVVLYKLAKRIDKNQHSKPIDHKRVVVNRKLKPAEVKYKRGHIKVASSKVNLAALQKLTETLFECCVQLEIFMAELKEAEYGKVQASVRSASQLPVWDGTPQEDRA